MCCFARLEAYPRNKPTRNPPINSPSNLRMKRKPDFFPQLFLTPSTSDLPPSGGIGVYLRRVSGGGIYFRKGVCFRDGWEMCCQHWFDYLFCFSDLQAHLLAHLMASHCPCLLVRCLVYLLSRFLAHTCYCLLG